MFNIFCMILNNIFELMFHKLITGWLFDVKKNMHNIFQFCFEIIVKIKI